LPVERGKDKITMEEVDDSVDRIVAGKEGTKMMIKSNFLSTAN